MALRWAAIWQLPLVAALSTLALYLEARFSKVEGILGIGVTFSVLFIVLLAVELARRWLWRDPYRTLRGILNSSVRQANAVTTVADFLTESNEEALDHGDEVHILTNSLSKYDSTPAAVDVTSKNILEGVKYVYYLPAKDFPALAQEKDAFVRNIIKANEQMEPSRLNQGLEFHVIDGQVLCNFATVQSTDTTHGYWYMTVPSNDVANPKLIIVELSEDQRDKLLATFAFLRRFPKVKASDSGL